jgi:hypothetical protein
MTPARAFLVNYVSIISGICFMSTTILECLCLYAPQSYWIRWYIESIWRTIFLAEGIWKVHIFRHLCMHWENFIRIGITVLYLKSCRCQLWIWWSQISVLLAPFRVCYSLDIVSTERYIYSTCIYCWNVATYNCKVTIVSFLVIIRS